MKYTVKQQELVDRFSLHYEGLIRSFASQIKDLDYKGMPEPHIPIIGSNYSSSKFKLAFFGIETAGWHEMEGFMEIAVKEPYSAATLHFDDIEDLTCLRWTNNPHTSFWDFIFLFLASFYHVDVKDVRNGKYPELIRSFIWGNTNSIERYDIQAAKNNVNHDVYEEIKHDSLIFDDSDHLVDIAKPKVVIVLNWNEGTNWFISDKTDYNYYRINDHLLYFYKRSTQTHIFQTHHPRSIAMRFGFEAVVNELLDQFKMCNVWGSLPESINDIFVTEQVKSNGLLRNELIADIATGLIKTHSVMCGQQLVEILNYNGITKDDGGSYVHGRGIYKPIKAAWDYYHNQLGDEQTAYNIAMAYVNANGDYAYD
jgi:hypothetical protein